MAQQNHNKKVGIENAAEGVTKLLEKMKVKNSTPPARI